VIDNYLAIDDCAGIAAGSVTQTVPVKAEVELVQVADNEIAK